MLFIIFQITMQNFKKFGVIEKKFNFGYSPTLSPLGLSKAAEEKNVFKSFTYGIPSINGSFNLIWSAEKLVEYIGPHI